jgi:hypothetical protein
MWPLSDDERMVVNAAGIAGSALGILAIFVGCSKGKDVGGNV